MIFSRKQHGETSELGEKKPGCKSCERDVKCFTAKAVREWLAKIGVSTLFIELGSPWENGYVESFIGKLRDELLNGEIFDTLLEAKVHIENWRRDYNQF